MRKRHINHPFLVVNSKYTIVKHKKHINSEIPNILYIPAKMSRHHLYPKDRSDQKGPYSNITIKIWCFKHFYGWNNLFQFFYEGENGEILPSELTIDEIITLMIERHPFIMNKIGSPPWKIVFKNKDIEEAIDLLCRTVSMKFNRPHLHVVHEKVDVAIPKKYRAIAA